MASDLERAFADEPALVAYVAAGDAGKDSDADPIEATKDHVRALVAGGADVVELGLPFSEPIAEGPTIQQAIRRALDAGMTPERYLDLVADLDDDPAVDVPLVCMTYYNLIYQFGASEARSASEQSSGDEPRDERGVEPFVEAAAEAGISGLVVPDLPVDESGPLKAACEAHGLDLVFIVAPTTTDERLDRMLEQASGFVYVQGRVGTTGARSDVSDQTHGSLARLDDTDLPKAVGFGVSEGEHAREIVAGGADGVVVGSAFVAVVASGEDVSEGLESLARELKTGAVEGGEERGDGVDDGRDGDAERGDVPEPERT